MPPITDDLIALPCLRTNLGSTESNSPALYVTFFQDLRRWRHSGLWPPFDGPSLQEIVSEHHGLQGPRHQIVGGDSTAKQLPSDWCIVNIFEQTKKTKKYEECVRIPSMSFSLNSSLKLGLKSLLPMMQHPSLTCAPHLKSIFQLR